MRPTSPARPLADPPAPAFAAPEPASSASPLAAAPAARIVPPTAVSRTTVVVAGVAWSVAVIAGAALLEWGGWQVVWRTGDPRLLDDHWRGMFAAGVARNVAGAVGVGAVSALAALAIAGARPRWRARARRAAVLAFGGGSLLFIAALAALLQLAP